MDERCASPAGIEAKSMEIISRELAQLGISLPPENAGVIRRVIHATADFGYASSLYFSEGAVRLGVEALSAGRRIVTDTNMALAGISKTGLSRLGSGSVCYMADEEVAGRAKALGVTRAAVSMHKAAGEYPDALYASGNAPTALFALSEMIREGLRPSLVIAVPVGFVNVTEAKEEIIRIGAEAGIPVIAAVGRKGGSTVAAAICNALIYEALGMTDPFSRE